MKQLINETFPHNFAQVISMFDKSIFYLKFIKILIITERHMIYRNLDWYTRIQL